MRLLGLLLAVVGVYSVVSYAAAQHTHVIGIRLALGAASRDILNMVLQQSLGVVVIGVAVGLAAALAGTCGLANKTGNRVGERLRLSAIRNAG